jgi:hypothetical protein
MAIYFTLFYFYIESLEKPFMQETYFWVRITYFQITTNLSNSDIHRTYATQDQATDLPNKSWQNPL